MTFNFWDQIQLSDFSKIWQVLGGFALIILLILSGFAIIMLGFRSFRYYLARFKWFRYGSFWVVLSK